MGTGKRQILSRSFRMACPAGTYTFKSWCLQVARFVVGIGLRYIGGLADRGTLILQVKLIERVESMTRSAKVEITRANARRGFEKGGLAPRVHGASPPFSDTL